MHPRLALTLAACALPALAATLPLRFEANAGQWHRDVRFSARTSGYQLFLTPRQAVVAFEGRTLGISLAGGNRAPEIAGVAPLAARANYFVGKRSDWHSGVAQYGRVRYTAVYPGIDVVYYGNGSELEYDFVLQPNADPARIRLKFTGADRVSLSPSGDLLLEVGGKTLVQKRPVVYQGSGNVEGRYRLLSRNTAGIELGGYDRSQPLTIDPVLSYATLIGGTGSDAVTAVQTDRAGNVYIAGYVNNNDLQGNDSSYQSASKGSTDGFLAIVNPNKSGADSLVYFTYIGGSAADQVNAMALDGTGKVILVGSTASSDFPLAGTNVVSSFGGGATDGFVLVLRPSAAGTDALLYGSFLGGSGIDVAYAVAVDNTGKIYVAGTTQSDNFPKTDSGYARVLYGGQDAFLVKINPDSSSPLMYGTYFGGESGDDGRALAITNTGIAYLAGATVSSQLPQAGRQYRDTLAGGADAFIAQFDTTKSGDASLVYSTYLGGTDIEEVRGIALDSGGKLLLTGYTLSGDFPTTPGAYRRDLAGSGDAFLVRFDPAAAPNAALMYSTFFGGSGGDVSYEVVADAAGGAWVTGYTLSLDFPVFGGPVQPSNPGGVEVFVSHFDLTRQGPASLVYSTYLGSTGVHVGYGLALAGDGTVYVGGYTGPKSIGVTGDAFQGGFGGGLSDGFVAVLKP